MYFSIGFHVFKLMNFYLLLGKEIIYAGVGQGSKWGDR